MRTSAEPRSAPATAVSVQALAPAPSMGASAQLRPCLPSGPLGRRSTGLPPSSTSLVCDGISEPCASVICALAFKSAGSGTPWAR